MHMIWHKRAVAQLIFLTALTLWQPGNVRAEDEPDADVIAGEDEAIGQKDQSTPLASAMGFMYFAESGDYDRAAEYLDLRYLPDELESVDGATLAEQLYVVVARKIPVDFGALSDEPEGRDRDGLPSYRDALGKIETSRGQLTIFPWCEVFQVDYCSALRNCGSRRLACSGLAAESICYAARC